MSALPSGLRFRVEKRRCWRPDGWAMRWGVTTPNGDGYAVDSWEKAQALANECARLRTAAVVGCQDYTSWLDAKTADRLAWGAVKPRTDPTDHPS